MRPSYHQPPTPSLSVFNARRQKMDLSSNCAQTYPSLPVSQLLASPSPSTSPSPSPPPPPPFSPTFVSAMHHDQRGAVAFLTKDYEVWNDIQAQPPQVRYAILTTGLSHLVERLNAGVIIWNWKRVLNNEFPAFVLMGGLCYHWTNISFTGDYVTFCLWYRKKIDSLAEVFLAIDARRADGKWFDRQGRQFLLQKQIDSPTAKVVEEIILAGGHCQVTVGSRTGVVHTNKISIPDDQYPSVHAVDVYFGTNPQPEHTLLNRVKLVKRDWGSL